MHEFVQQAIKSSIAVKEEILRDQRLMDLVMEVANMCIIAIKDGKKILFCGNGGSSADAQHLAAELSGRFYFDRDPFFAEALHTNSSFITAVANDYSYEEVFSRAVKAKGRPGDILFCMSTSGKSLNIVKAAHQAQKIGMITIAMTGVQGNALAEQCSILLNVPSADTPRIQEAHMLIGHVICAYIEKQLLLK